MEIRDKTQYRFSKPECGTQIPNRIFTSTLNPRLLRILHSHIYRTIPEVKSAGLKEFCKEEKHLSNQTCWPLIGDGKIESSEGNTAF